MTNRRNIPYPKRFSKQYSLFRKNFAFWFLIALPAAFAVLVVLMQFFPNGPTLLVTLSNEILDEVVQHPVKLALAFFALVYFFHEIRLRRKLLEQELSIKKEQLLAEQEDRENKSKWLKDQVGVISNVTGELSKRISEELNNNVAWACEGLEKAKLGLHSNTLFGMRKRDFSDEKQFIAKNFSMYLLDRIK